MYAIIGYSFEGEIVACALAETYKEAFKVANDFLDEDNIAEAEIEEVHK